MKTIIQQTTGGQETIVILETPYEIRVRVYETKSGYKLQINEITNSKN